MSLLQPTITLGLAHFSPFGCEAGPASLGFGGAEGGAGTSLVGRSPASAGPTPLGRGPGRCSLGPERPFIVSAHHRDDSRAAALRVPSLPVWAGPEQADDPRCPLASSRPSLA